MNLMKLIAIGIIFLFIGVAVAPSINSTVVKASDDLVEVTSQACGIQGFGNTTVTLTRKQCQNLENYFVTFRARLNQTKTQDEAIPLFKDAIMELNKDGLLPKGMSVERAQKLIIRYEKSTHTTNRITSLKSSGLSNLFCLIAGIATNCLLSSVITAGIQLMFYILFQVIDFGYYSFGAGLLALIWLLFSDAFFYRNVPILGVSLSMFSLFSILTFGFDAWGPSEGWIFTLGLLGKRTYTGSFTGQIPYPVITVDGYTAYTGVFGFTGFKISFSSPDFVSLFLGTALRVNLVD